MSLYVTTSPHHHFTTSTYVTRHIEFEHNSQPHEMRMVNEGGEHGVGVDLAGEVEEGGKEERRGGGEG
jgi:hypothetical protein